MHLPIRHILLALFAASALGGSAQQWTIGQCIDYASAHHFGINTLRLEQDLAREELLLARSARLPGLSVSVGNTFTNASSPAGSGSRQLTSAGNYTINSSITIWNNNYLNNTIKQRGLERRSAELATHQLLNTVTLQVANYYLDILLFKENSRYVADLVTTSKARVQQGELLYKNGSIAKKELLQLQAQLSSDEYLLTQSDNEVRQSLLYLRQLLQLPENMQFDIVSPSGIDTSSMMTDLSIVQQSALEQFPDFTLGKIGLEIAKTSYLRAKAGAGPVLSANANVGTSYSDELTNGDGTKTSYFNQTKNNFFQHAGIMLSIPIFSNRINRTNIARAEIAYNQAGLQLQNNRLVLLQAVEQSYIRAQNGRASYRAASAQLTAASETYRISNEQFKLGATDSYELLQQRNQYIQAVQAFTQSKYSAILQQMIYEYYGGKPISF